MSEDMVNVLVSWLKENGYGEGINRQLFSFKKVGDSTVLLELGDETFTVEFSTGDLSNSSQLRNWLNEFSYIFSSDGFKGGVK